MPPSLTALLSIHLLFAQPVSRPTLAVEDTLHTEVAEILVTAPRVTLDEILDRVARGEARRDSLMRDQAFTATMRLVEVEDAPGGPRGELVAETVTRVYKRRPAAVRAVELRRWRAERRLRGNLRIEFSPSMGERVVNFAFRPENRRDYRFRIAGRELLGERLIYRIDFVPRSPLDRSQPRGTVWVDTNEFVVVRQEVHFDRSPAPLFLRGVDRLVVERQQVAGHWVLRRVLMRARTTFTFGALPRWFDVSLHFDDYSINAGIDDAVFAPGGRG